MISTGESTRGGEDAVAVRSVVEQLQADRQAAFAGLEARGVDVHAFGKLVMAYKAAEGVQRENAFEGIENALRKMSYENIVDTRAHARQALVEAWAADRKASPNQSHLMLAFTNTSCSDIY